MSEAVVHTELAAVEAELERRQDVIDAERQAIATLKRKRDALAEDPSVAERRRINTAYWMAVFADAKQWGEFVDQYTDTVTRLVTASFKDEGFRTPDATLAAKHTALSAPDLTRVFTFARDHGMHVFHVENGMPVAFERIDYSAHGDPGLGPFADTVRTDLRAAIPELDIHCSKADGCTTSLVWLRKAFPFPYATTARPWLAKLRRRQRKAAAALK